MALNLPVVYIPAPDNRPLKLFNERVENKASADYQRLYKQWAEGREEVQWRFKRARADGASFEELEDIDIAWENATAKILRHIARARKAAWEEVKAEDKAKAKAQAELLERLEKEKSPEDKENEREDMEDHRHAVLDMARARENKEMLERFLDLDGKGPGQGEGPGQGDGGNMSNEDGGTRPAAGYPGFVRSRPSRPWAYGVMYPWA